MNDRLRQDHQLHAVRALREAAEEDERAGPDAAFEAATRDQEPGRGGGPAVARAIDGLHASAGNGAVAWLLGGRGRRHRAGTPSVAAGRAAVAGTPRVQRAPGDDDDKLAAQGTDPKPTTDPNALAGKTDADSSGDTGSNDNTGDTSGQGGQQQGSGTTTPGGSWTKIGPPTNGTYTVSGSLRTVATAIEARTEAGSVTTTPSSDTDTYTPEGGTEKVTAARVTVAQKMELPDWSDKANATQGQQNEWNRFMTAITTHENGHVAVDKTSFAGAHSKMIGLSQADADKKLDGVTAQATTDNETYDTGNDHGKKQGTGINPNIDEVTKVP